MKKLCIALGLLPFLSCSDTGQLQEIGKLDLKEVSALEYIPATTTLWALEDSGNDNKLYKIGGSGKILETVTVTGAVNIDWESLAADAQGNLYIGDFGNNDNERKDLAIYRLNAADPGKVAAKIEFYYPEQAGFPPKKSKRIFDCEAFFEHKGNFYLFTKNRSARFDGTFSVYRVPNKEGRHAARLLAQLTTCGVYSKCAVTGADISPDGTKAVLLTGDKLFVINDFERGIANNAGTQMFSLGHLSQKEGICFKDNDTLLIADEKDKHTGGRLYQVSMSQLQAKP